MGKIIYITEDIARELENKITPMTELPQDIKNVLRNHKTSLGTHPAFPPEEEIPFDASLTLKRFNEVVDKAAALDLNDYSPSAIQRELKALTDKCKEIEKSYKEQLENLCYNYIIDMFQVPEGLVNFTCNLVEKVDADKAPVANGEHFEFEDIAHRSRLHDAVYKRRLINAMITGGAMRLSVISKQLIGELYEMSPELPAIYKKITVLNDYLLFTKNNMGISEKAKKQAGVSYLTIGNDRVKNTVRVEAEIFPILLHESIRGFLEMFAAYGLPSSKKECVYIMSKADFIDAEPWDMRIGPAIWDYLMMRFEEPETENIPMLLTVLFSQTTNKFNSILQEIFGETKRGERMVQKILMKAQEEFEADDFEKLMTKKQTDNSMITDGYFIPEEL
jgi:hypothetical protein